MNQEAKILSITGLITLILLAGGIFFLGKSTSPTNTKADNTLLIRNNSHKISSDSAKLTVVEFGDFQCPACGMAEPTVEQLLTTYSGRVNFVFRNFPLPQHANAIPAALAAEAAGQQGKYWPMHNLLYAKQNDWADLPNPTNTFIQYAQQLQLDTNKFTQDMQSEILKNFITQDQNDGNSLGVDATPTFYINQMKYPGSFDYATMKQAFDQALGQ